MQPFQEVRSPARRKFNEIYRSEFVGTSVNLNFWQKDKIWIVQHGMAVKVEHVALFACLFATWHVTYWGMKDDRFG